MPHSDLLETSVREEQPPMRIAIDFSAFLPQMTGVDTYLKQLLSHLAVIDRHNQYRIFHNREDRHLFTHDLPPNFSSASACARPRLIRLIFQQILLPMAAAAWRADVVHSPSFIMPYVRGSARHVLTVQDMTSFSHPSCHTPLRRSLAYRRMVLSSLRRSDVVTVPSEATRQAILDMVPGMPPERLRVTVLGIGDEFRVRDEASVAEASRRFGLPRPYILHVGTIEPRKNLKALVTSYRKLLDAGAITEDLVLAGKLGWAYEEVLKEIQHPSLRGKVHLLGYVDQQELPALYSGARLFVYPSLHEGFGFPPLEAMACGVPVISTLSSSLVENLAGVAELVPLDDSAALGDAMRRLLTEETLWSERRELGLTHARRYRWEATARATVNSYEAALRMEPRHA